MTVLWLLTWFSCAHTVPTHLAIPSSNTPAPDGPLTGLEDTIAHMIGKDPLARTPTFPPLDELPDDPSLDVLRAFMTNVTRLESSTGDRVIELQQMASRATGTSVVPLTRGYRLRMIENMLAADGWQAQEFMVVPLITPLVGEGEQSDALPRSPLRWLSSSDDDLRVDVRRYADRWVLTGWLGDPSIPLDAVANGLKQPNQDALALSPTGQLIAAIVENATADPEPGLSILRRATHLALTRAAADRDSELAAWADLKRPLIDELGPGDPIQILLRQAIDALIPAAADHRAAGGALLAIAAQRWVGSCPWLPCSGVDRVHTMRLAENWHPELQELARTWQIIALKESLDAMEVGRRSVLFPRATVDLVDALLGLGAGPLHANLLRASHPNETTWQALGTAVSVNDTADFVGARAALGAFLGTEIAACRDVVTNKPNLTLLDRISRRALR